MSYIIIDDGMVRPATPEEEEALRTRDRIRQLKTAVRVYKFTTWLFCAFAVWGFLMWMKG